MSVRDASPPLAVALTFDGVNAPQLSAKGEGDVASHILQLATEHEIPIYQNSELLKVLMRVELDEEIPRGLYVAVAEIIAFAYRLKGKLPANYDAE